MKFAKMCGPLQLYVLMCLISFLIQLHNLYTTKSFSWVNAHKVHLLLTLVFNFVVFVLWGRVINSLCMTQNKMIAWILLFFPLFIALVTTGLFLSGVFMQKVGDELDSLL